jgi:hypothetical protein
MLIKKGFPFFCANAYNANKNKKICFFKIQFGYKKTLNFMLISNPLKTFLKNVLKNLLATT